MDNAASRLRSSGERSPQAPLSISDARRYAMGHAPRGNLGTGRTGLMHRLGGDHLVEDLREDEVEAAHHDAVLRAHHGRGELVGAGAAPEAA